MFFPELLMPKDINSIMKDVYKNWDEQLFNKYLSEFKLKIINQLNLCQRG